MQSVNTAAARTQRTTILVVGFVGFLVFLITAGIASWLTWSSYNRDQTWTSATATVEKLDILCDVEKKNGKNWDLVDTLPCAEASKIVAEREGVFSSWRSTEVEFALLAYQVNGKAQEVRVRSVVIADGPLTVGASIPILVNPSNPIDVAKPFTSADITSFWVMVLIGAGIWAFAIVIGIFVAGRNRAAQEKRAVATSLTESHWGGAQAPDTQSVRPAATSLAANAPPALPAWSRILRWIGIVVLLLSIGFAVLAAIGSKGDREVLIGAGVIFAIGFIVWALLRFIAGRARPSLPEPTQPNWGRQP